MRKAVFFDRDGVLNMAIVQNGKPYPPSRVEELVITPGAIEQLPILRKMGYLLIGITNQPDVARGKQTIKEVEEINLRLLMKLPLQEIFVCFHDDQDNCNCRKPQPGLIFQAANKYDIDLPNSFVIGDRWKDVAAGISAGCHTILIDHGYSESNYGIEPEKTVHTLSEAVDYIVNFGGKK